MAVDDWLSLIVGVLRRSPNLCKLSLSFSTELTGNISNKPLYDNFLTRLCHAYGEEDTMPLQPRSLHCGLGMYPTDEAAIRKLTDLAFLEEVYVDSRNIVSKPSRLTVLLSSQTGLPQISLDSQEGDAERG